MPCEWFWGKWNCHTVVTFFGVSCDKGRMKVKWRPGCCAAHLPLVQNEWSTRRLYLLPIRKLVTARFNTVWGRQVWPQFTAHHPYTRTCTYISSHTYIFLSAPSVTTRFSPSRSHTHSRAHTHNNHERGGEDIEVEEDSVIPSTAPPAAPLDAQQSEDPYFGMYNTTHIHTHHHTRTNKDIHNTYSKPWSVHKHKHTNIHTH